ncbi:MAG TPA: hypothetical protein VMX74_11335 [Pirellulales bacterium]|nr:hypothetical protein [Pirellulales bacterium]
MKPIIKLRREGYRLWRIAEMTGSTINEVAKVLVDHGLLKINVVEARIANESKPTREQIKSGVKRLAATRIRQNVARRRGGGTWRGRQ